MNLLNKIRSKQVKVKANTSQQPATIKPTVIQINQKQQQQSVTKQPSPIKVPPANQTFNPMQHPPQNTLPNPTSNLPPSKLLTKTKPTTNSTKHKSQKDYLLSKAKIFFSPIELQSNSVVFGQIISCQTLNDILFLKVRNYDEDFVFVSLAEDALYDPERVKYIGVRNVIRYEEEGKSYCVGLKINIVHVVYKE